MRAPTALTDAIHEHKAHFNKEPELIMLKASYHRAHTFYFSGRLHVLCCGKGMLFSGIPTIITSSPMVEDFLICY